LFQVIQAFASNPFFHHFDSKETLVTELMQMLLTRLDKQFDRLMAEEENADVTPTGVKFAPMTSDATTGVALPA
jgi:AcrR family transcriptional regulator